MTTATEPRALSPLALAARRHNARVAAAHPAEEFRQPATIVQSPEGAAAWALLDRALAATPAFAQALDRGGMVLIIEVPGADWIRPVKQTLQAHLKAANEKADKRSMDDFISSLAVDDEVHEDTAPPPPDPPEPPRPNWLWLDIADRESPSDIDEDRVITALTTGQGVLAVTATVASLPPFLLSGADHRLVLSRLDGAALTLAAHVLDGERPQAVIGDDLCRFLTMADLRFAKRPGEDGNDWIGRLHGLAQARKGSTDDGPTLVEIHGMDEATAWGLDLVRDLEDFAAGRLGWHEVDRGCLLYGPPGTGKTSFARALARTAGLPLVTGSHSAWQAAGHQGQMLAAMRSTFAEARRLAPCVLFVDEVDAFPDRNTLRQYQRDYTVQVVNALLEQMDGALNRAGVIVLAAANSLTLDPALVRPGRLDRIIMVPLPSEAALAKILRQHLGPEHLPGIDFAPFTVGLTASGADCEFWSRCAKRAARGAGRPMIIEDLLAQIPRPLDMPSDLLRRIAIHEAGHAVAAAVELPGQMRLVKMQGETAGVMFEFTPSLTTDEAWAQVRILLAGRAAEELLLGSIGLGSGGVPNSDLARATTVAVTMLAGHGSGDSLVWLGEASTDTVLGFLNAYPRLNEQVGRMLAEEQERVMDLLRPRRPVIDRIATLLLERGSLSGQEVEELVAAMSTGVDTAS